MLPTKTKNFQSHVSRLLLCIPYSFVVQLVEPHLRHPVYLQAVLLEAAPSGAPDPADLARERLDAGVGLEVSDVVSPLTENPVAVLAGPRGRRL